MVLKVILSDFLPFHSSSWYCSINRDKTGNPYLLSLWTVSAQQAPFPVPVQTFQYKTKNLSLLPSQTVPAKQGPLPGQVAGLNTGLKHPILVL